MAGQCSKIITHQQVQPFHSKKGLKRSSVAVLPFLYLSQDDNNNSNISAQKLKWGRKEWVSSPFSVAAEVELRVAEELAVGSRAITVMNRSWESHCQAATRHTKWPPFSSNVTTCYCPSCSSGNGILRMKIRKEAGEAPPDTRLKRAILCVG